MTRACRCGSRLYERRAVLHVSGRLFHRQARPPAASARRWPCGSPWWWNRTRGRWPTNATNAEWILEQGAGVVVSSFTKVADAVRELLRPDRYNPVPRASRRGSQLGRLRGSGDFWRRSFPASIAARTIRCCGKAHRCPAAGVAPAAASKPALLTEPRPSGSGEPKPFHAKILAVGHAAAPYVHRLFRLLEDPVRHEPRSGVPVSEARSMKKRLSSLNLRSANPQGLHRAHRRGGHRKNALWLECLRDYLNAQRVALRPCLTPPDRGAVLRDAGVRSGFCTATGCPKTEVLLSLNHLLMERATAATTVLIVERSPQSRLDVLEEIRLLGTGDPRGKCYRSSCRPAGAGPQTGRSGDRQLKQRIALRWFLHGSS